MGWKKLSKEKPETEGYYLTYNPKLKNTEPTRFVVDFWFSQYKMFTYADGVSHWAVLERPKGGCK